VDPAEFVQHGQGIEWESFFAQLDQHGITKDQFIHLLKWALNFVETGKKIKSAPGVRQRLDELQHAGADPEAVVHGIILSTQAGAVATTCTQLKQLATQLTRLAKRLERIGREVEATVSDPWCHSAFWRTLLIEGSQDFTAVQERWDGAHQATRRIRAFVGFFHAEAKAIKSISKLFREYGKKSRGEVRVRLSRHVKRVTGQYHDECMAELLQTAYDVMGIKGNFSSEQVRQLRSRPKKTRYLM
jgi:hypothetical protein